MVRISKECAMRSKATAVTIRKVLGLFLACVGLGAVQARAADKPPPQYHYIGEIAVGGDTGWDYLSIDARARRLYVTHGSHIAVIDLDAGRVVGEIPDTPGVHGFALAGDFGRGFSSNGAEAKVSVVELATLKTLGKVGTQEGPDAILYEPGRKEVYAFNGRAHSATVIAVPADDVVATVPLPGKPEFAAADPGANRVFVNIEDKNEIVAIDTAQHQIVNTWPIAPGESASGMAFDASHHRLFIGCENKLMLMIDSTTGKVVASVPIDAGVDANAFDSQLQLAFSSNGSGTLTIAHEDSPRKLTVVQTLQTQPSARTMALDPTTHRVYLAAATLLPAPAPEPGAPRHRPAVAPGSFKILVYGPAD
jgi:DNA-binding beta-propeller fold protein YncE